MNTQTTLDAPVAEQAQENPIATTLRWLAAGQLAGIVGSSGAFIRLSYSQQSGSVTLDVHGLPDYHAGVEVMRRLGVQRWNKRTISSEKPYCYLDGTLAPDVFVSLYCAGLTPTCKLVKRTVRVPKSQTVETGEFIEIERTEVVCGNNEPEAA